MKNTIILILFFTCTHSFCQDCANDNFKSGLRRGQTYTANCDSMVVLTKPTYERLQWENYQKQHIIESFDKSEKLFVEKTQLLDSLVDRYKTHTDSLDKYLSEKQSQITRLDSLLVKSTDNTDKALDIARKNRTFSIISSSISIVLLIVILL